MPNRHNCSPGRWNIRRDQISVSEKSALGITTSFSIPSKFACALRGRRVAAFFFWAGFSVPICSSLQSHIWKWRIEKPIGICKTAVGPLWLANKCLNSCQGLVRLVPWLVAPGLSIAGSFPILPFPRAEPKAICVPVSMELLLCFENSDLQFSVAPRGNITNSHSEKNSSIEMEQSSLEYQTILFLLAEIGNLTALFSIFICLDTCVEGSTAKLPRESSRTLFPLVLNSRSLRKRKKINF